MFNNSFNCDLLPAPVQLLHNGHEFCHIQPGLQLPGGWLVYLLWNHGTLLTSLQGTSRGFRIYHTDPFAKIFSSNDGNVAIIEMLFSTSLVALILSPRHLVIQNTKVEIGDGHCSIGPEPEPFHHERHTDLLVIEILDHLRTYIPLRGPCRKT